jgi:hypothetical protein
MRMPEPVLRNALLDVRDADVGSRPADTIKLNFNPYGLGGARARHQGHLTNREVVSAWRLAARAHILLIFIIPEQIRCECFWP